MGQGMIAATKIREQIAAAGTLQQKWSDDGVEVLDSTAALVQARAEKALSSQQPGRPEYRVGERRRDGASVERGDGRVRADIGGAQR